ncbi:MAG TPA: competence/damage-inducible protein A, partial [Thermoleophilaceae bacterium]
MPATVRAGMVVTGTEVLTGRVRDRNGPWVAEQLLGLGVELAHVTICGDRPDDIEAQLRFLADEGVDLILTSGGLGPTADDMTVEVVARFSGRELILDEPLEERIVQIVRPLMERLGHTDVDAIRAANRKQALIPAGAHVIQPVGTAPGVVVPGSPPVVVLPGPPFELQGMWERALATPPVRAALGERPAYEQGMLRLFGIPESAIAETLRLAEAQIDGFERLEITTCLRRAEVEVVTRWEPEDVAAYAALERLVAERHAEQLFSRDGSTIDEQVATLLVGRRLALAESCTGGLLTGRLTERPGSSAYVLGGVVSYADEAKVAQLGVDPALIANHGAVSIEVAEAMAEGVCERFGADIALSIT